MTDRTAQADAFLATTDWADAQRSPLAGDASNRKYERLSHDRLGAAVLMDAPPEKNEDVRPFVAIAQHLTALGLSAPRIFAQDTDNGFLLLEDLGDGLFARLVERDPTIENSLYSGAIDVLSALHKTPPPETLPAYNPSVMTEMALLAWRWYLPATGVATPPTEEAFARAFRSRLTDLANDQSALILRDYHAENLLWLPERTGVAKVGLLDFQDAMRGHPAYDLVSLLQDARRDVPLPVEQAMLARYVTQTGRDPDTFANAYHLLGAQRNLRILGVFARLCLRDGKQHYVDLIPRVWGLLQRDLAHPALAPLRDLVLGALPEPTPNILKRLKDQCATYPKP